MINGSAQYATANRFRLALEDRLKAEAKARGRSLGELRREFLFQRFLALIFSTPDVQWVLKGGAGLLTRLAEARFSKDLDLLHLGEVTPDQAIAELRSLTAARDGDHLTFIVENGVAYSRTNPVVEISVTAYIGARYDSFPIDLARELHLLAAPERIRPTPVVHVPGLTELPEVVVYPLSDHVADKVCAMFELYGERANPSSRHRDLIDLALIVSTCDLDAAPVSRALLSESERRVMKLPEQMVSPGPQWPNGYAAYARKTKIDESFHALEAAIEHVGRCVNPLLSGARSTGRWHPGVGWSDPPVRGPRARTQTHCNCINDDHLLPAPLDAAALHSAESSGRLGSPLVDVAWPRFASGRNSCHASATHRGCSGLRPAETGLISSNRGSAARSAAVDDHC